MAGGSWLPFSPEQRLCLLNGEVARKQNAELIAEISHSLLSFLMMDLANPS
jgi:chaperone required for assembly of F1-ATPase